ncbi:hypothetical protein M9H77_18765 [Catharanthus roseus]|uniref:Uncharacterized protein n=1 Tax=Catharanthus roseus TaxID=4058 RepID=A0ACC0B8C1_CATRO|nr:hypothetical protein M9H77_18765 [Catharanthus roseus]
MWKLNICERVLSWKDNWLGVELYKRVFCNRYLRRRKGSTSLAFSDHWSLIRGRVCERGEVAAIVASKGSSEFALSFIGGTLGKIAYQSLSSTLWLATRRYMSSVWDWKGRYSSCLEGLWLDKEGSERVGVKVEVGFFAVTDVCAWIDNNTSSGAMRWRPELEWSLLFCVVV